LITILKTNSENLFQTETICFNVNRKIIWEIITNWVVFKKHVDFIAEEVNYNGNNNEEGSELVLSWPSKRVACHFKIKKNLL